MTRFSTSLVGVICLGIRLAAQTQVDLRTQTKSVDFGNAPFTKPLKTGAALPAACTVGELFFLTTAGPGNNVYACVTANTWIVQTGGGAGATTIQNSGTNVGTRPILNLSNGAGVVLSTSDTGTTISIQTGLDTSVAQTKASAQAGTALLCASASASGTTYTCALSPTLSVYTSRMVLNWIPDVNGSGGPTTINVDGLGAVAVKLADGITDPGPADIVADRLQAISYNGTSFVLARPSTAAGILGEAQPACSSLSRGRLWFVPGTTGVKDGLTVCAKDAMDVYAWRTLY